MRLLLLLSAFLITSAYIHINRPANFCDGIRCRIYKREITRSRPLSLVPSKSLPFESKPNALTIIPKFLRNIWSWIKDFVLKLFNIQKAETPINKYVPPKPPGITVLDPPTPPAGFTTLSPPPVKLTAAEIKTFEPVVVSTVTTTVVEKVVEKAVEVDNKASVFLPKVKDPKVDIWASRKLQEIRERDQAKSMNIPPVVATTSVSSTTETVSSSTISTDVSSAAAITRNEVQDLVKESPIITTTSDSESIAVPSTTFATTTATNVTVIDAVPTIIIAATPSIVEEVKVSEATTATTTATTISFPEETVSAIEGFVSAINSLDLSSEKIVTTSTPKETSSTTSSSSGSGSSSSSTQSILSEINISEAMMKLIDHPIADSPKAIPVTVTSEIVTEPITIESSTTETVVITTTDEVKPVEVLTATTTTTATTEKTETSTIVPPTVATVVIDVVEPVVTLSIETEKDSVIVESDVTTSLKATTSTIEKSKEVTAPVTTTMSVESTSAAATASSADTTTTTTTTEKTTYFPKKSEVIKNNMNPIETITNMITGKDKKEEKKDTVMSAVDTKKSEDVVSSSVSATTTTNAKTVTDTTSKVTATVVSDMLKDIQVNTDSFDFYEDPSVIVGSGRDLQIDMERIKKELEIMMPISLMHATDMTSGNTENSSTHNLLDDANQMFSEISLSFEKAIHSVDSVDSETALKNIRNINRNEFLQEIRKNMSYVVELIVKEMNAQPTILTISNTESDGTTEKLQEVPLGPVDYYAVTIPKITKELFQVTPSFGDNVTDSQGNSMNMENIKSAGISGTLAYIVSELGFWAVSIPVIIASYHTSTGEWLNFANPTDRVVILGLAAGIVSAARLALPLRLAAAVALTPIMDKYITKKYIDPNTTISSSSTTTTIAESNAAKIEEISEVLPHHPMSSYQNTNFTMKTV